MRRFATLIAALLVSAALPGVAEARWQNSAGVFYDDAGSPLCKCRNGVRLRIAINTNTTTWTAVRVIVTRSLASHDRLVLADEVVPLAPVSSRPIEVQGGEVTVDHMAVATVRYTKRLNARTRIVVYTQKLVGGTPFDFGTVGAGTAIVYRTGRSLLATAKPSTRCLGRRATILGTRRSNRLNGTPGNDVIVGLGGNDVIDGRGGNDLICAGTGNDRVTTRFGASVVLGEAGNDLIVDGNGPAVLLGGAGRDHLIAHDGADVLGGGPDDDLLEGGDGADTLYGEQGRDRLWPGTSPDDGGSGNQLVEGGAGDDTLRYDAGWDAVDGGAGRDLLLPGPGAPAFTVLLGPRSITGISEGEACLILIADCVDAIPVVPYASPVFGIEAVLGTDGADALHAPADSLTAYAIDGGGGDDTISGSAGPDRLLGGDGGDSIDGGGGFDLCEGEALVNCP